jgi:hypothetical protein
MATGSLVDAQNLQKYELALERLGASSSSKKQRPIVERAKPALTQQGSSIGSGKRPSRALEPTQDQIQWRRPMSASSDRIIELLQQISVLKELDEQYRAGPKSDYAIEDSKQRRKRRQQIRNEMKELASCARKKVPSER